MLYQAQDAFVYDYYTQFLRHRCNVFWLLS